MITTVEIKGFKRFREQPFDLAPLTLLTGKNGAGKTSLVHALLLAWEANSKKNCTVRLNGPFGMELGTAEDVQNWASGDTIEFRITSESGQVSTWLLAAASDDALYLNIKGRPSTAPMAFSGRPRAFSYLCAERLGPRSVLGASPGPADELEVGARGEYCAQIIENLGNKPLADGRRLHPDRAKSEPSLLKYEVERWLGEIVKPIEIDAMPFSGSAITALRFRSPGGGWVRAPNMGFGVSYALPIILSGLTAVDGGLVIVENPEAHLHPAGQSRMGVFLAWLAGCGVQVVVETHSDHVLNGVRRAIGEFDYLKYDSAIAHYFESDELDEARVCRLDFTPLGGISHWPKGFFDQYQIDIASLGRVRRGRERGVRS
ncbi:AAA family ATPase [Ralstonia pseudosolanacearum]